MTLKNPKRSGGPKSTEGKLVASHNALKTGTYSGLAVLPNENQEEFNQLVDQFNYDFHPSDVIETTLVREMAVILWKKLRLEKLEQGSFIKKQNAPITMDELIDCGLKFNQERYDFWVDFEKLGDEDCEKYTKLLTLIRPHRKGSITVDQLIEIIKVDPSVRQSLIDGYQFLGYFADENISDQTLISATCCDSDQVDEYLTAVCFQHLVKKYEPALWCTLKHNKIAQAVIQIKQERLFEMMQSDGVRRANDDLSRSYIRTLGEFRKHNEWRMRHRVIDTEEE